MFAALYWESKRERRDEREQARPRYVYCISHPAGFYFSFHVCSCLYTTAQQLKVTIYTKILLNVCSLPFSLFLPTYVLQLFLLSSLVPRTGVWSSYHHHTTCHNECLNKLQIMKTLPHSFVVVLVTHRHVICSS